MLHVLSSRPVHILLLLGIGGILFFPNLGSHSLWDVDEAHNAECAREMLDAENWVVPTFNFVLRTDKPALLYWLIMLAYEAFGVSEFAARFWSAVCGLGSVILTYELGRRMFCQLTGLLAGVILASSFMFCVSSHAATPDALLIFTALATFFVFWRSYERGGQGWLLGVGGTMALAVLAKGAVGLVLPFTILGLFLLWERRLGALLNWRLFGGVVVFALIAVPWYALVAHDTKWEFLRGFFLKHHVERFQAPMEGHGGWFFYHPLVFLASFAPWSAFLVLTAWFGLGRRARGDLHREDARDNGGTATFLSTASPYRFLWCWFGVWMLFFSVAGTKLPNYLLPAFPAFAVLTGRFLARWLTGGIQLRAAWMLIAFCCVGLVGLCISSGLLAAAGWLPWFPLHGREMPELAFLVPVGLILVLSAAAAICLALRNHRGAAIGALAAGSVGCVALLAAWGPLVVDHRKAPRPLAEQMAHRQLDREVQIGCYEFYQPSLVWYTQRKVERFAHPTDAVDLLHSPTQSFLVLPTDRWEQLRSKLVKPTAIITRRWDFMVGKEIVVVTNRVPDGTMSQPTGSATASR
jgi:4-amino-4-deoxy-L-arabinose transferase-like glycosyltransferase